MNRFATSATERQVIQKRWAPTAGPQISLKGSHLPFKDYNKWCYVQERRAPGALGNTCSETEATELTALLKKPTFLLAPQWALSFSSRSASPEADRRLADASGSAKQRVRLAHLEGPFFPPSLGGVDGLEALPQSHTAGQRQGMVYLGNEPKRCIDRAMNREAQSRNASAAGPPEMPALVLHWLQSNPVAKSPPPYAKCFNAATR